MKKLLITCVTIIGLHFSGFAQQHFRFKDVRRLELAKSSPSIKGLIDKKSLKTIYGDFNIQGQFGRTIPLATAIQDVARYASNNAVNTTTYSFVFDTLDLKNYLEGGESSQLEIMMAENANHEIYVILALQDNEGGHIYLENNANCYLFASLSTIPNGLTTTLEANTESKLKDHYYTYLSLNNANTWITNYYNHVNAQGAQKLTTAIWTYPPDVLLRYVKNAMAGKAKYIRFILCKNDKNFLDFVICAVNENNKHRYFNQNLSDCVLENCDPCPTCETNPLEPNCQ